MQLHNLPQRNNRITKKKRVGRGPGSGKGQHTVGRGTKGQLSRSGHKSMLYFEGGQRPFYKKTPKFPGFKPVNKIKNQPINVEIIEAEYSAGEEVTIESLRSKGLIKKRTTHVKVLGQGDLNKSVTIKGLAVSDSAKQKIEKAGGSIEE